MLIFPHAILHEAGLSFIGLGIEPHLPSIGVILSESLRAIMAGQWWVSFFPGASLMLVAVAGFWWQQWRAAPAALDAPPALEQRHERGRH